MKTLMLNEKWISSQPVILTLLRIAIGWHFLWEGCIKLANPTWTAAGYLKGSEGPFAALFQFMANLTIKDTPLLNQWFSQAADANWLMIPIDFLMPWLLFLSGLGLMLGLFTRTSAITAIVLLLLFIAANPAFDFNPSMNNLEWKTYFSDLAHAQWAGNSAFGSEGNYYLISKNMVEMFALAALLTFDPRQWYGLDMLFAARPARQEEMKRQEKSVMQPA